MKSQKVQIAPLRLINSKKWCMCVHAEASSPKLIWWMWFGLLPLELYSPIDKWLLSCKFFLCLVYSLCFRELLENISLPITIASSVNTVSSLHTVGSQNLVIKIRNLNTLHDQVRRSGTQIKIHKYKCIKVVKIWFQAVVFQVWSPEWQHQNYLGAR